MTKQIPRNCTPNSSNPPFPCRQGVISTRKRPSTMYSSQDQWNYSVPLLNRSGTYDLNHSSCSLRSKTLLTISLVTICVYIARIPVPTVSARRSAPCRSTRHSVTLFQKCYIAEITLSKTVSKIQKLAKKLQDDSGFLGVGKYYKWHENIPTVYTKHPTAMPIPMAYVICSSSVAGINSITQHSVLYKNSAGVGCERCETLGPTRKLLKCNNLLWTNPEASAQSSVPLPN